jgi:hypothetical protein
MDDSSAWRACDRCYATKERCRRSDGTSVCARCQRLNYSCTTTRDAFRPGRRMNNMNKRMVRAGPQERPTPTYSFQTEIASNSYHTPSQSSSRTDLSTLSPAYSSWIEKASNSFSTPTLNSSRTDPSITSSVHASQAELAGSSHSTPPPSSSLAVSAGRPSPIYAPPVDEAMASCSYLTPPMSSALASLADLSSIPRSFFQTRLSDENLFASTRSNEQFLQYFVHGINFVPSLGSLVQERRFQHPELIEEGLLACAGAVFRARSKMSGFDDLDMSRSAVALRKLRYAPVSEDQAGGILTLGNLLTTYELLTSSQTAYAITRFTLSLIQPLYYSKPEPQPMPTELISLVFLDIVECLVRREVPIIKFRCEDLTLIDRFAGLCCPLLPILYELCQVGNILAQGGAQNEREERLLAEQIKAMEHKLNVWRPTPAPGFAAQFGSTDVIFLLTQARVYRGVALLVLHRLQHPFGEEDDLGARFSYYILSESALCVDLLGGGNAIPKTLFPWMIAALELTKFDERRALLAQMPANDREIMAMVIARMKEFIKHVWAARDQGNKVSWFDLVATAPPFSVMP